MEFERYQEMARRTQNPELTLLERRLHALHGLASEVGEIHGIYQKGFQGHPVRPEDVTDELGDVLGVSLSSVAQRNVDKLMARYPEGFSEERSLNRDVVSEEKKDGGLTVRCHKPEDCCEDRDPTGWCSRFDRMCEEVHDEGEAEDE